ncbi:TcmI family type II polyketide cyclase [Actinomadura rubrisoli]|uniref:TcmI family type II polyketide cyclase n=1 Tax=Actinomadura rubrisoli TaxID=2530368 RepID=A0A4R5B9A3_9ACTN|nr:TcmI family type II polyketide cyclase [Actinomadura rubrisoli]TDD82055.1 TcmI family type II polyketide cyclase [Actinomadura rubrisoli]
MHSTLVVARLDPADAGSVADLFADFDKTEMPFLMGTRRRELFHYRGLYFHLQDFDGDHGGEAAEQAEAHPRFKRLSADLKPFIAPYDPETRTPYDPKARRSPQDATATRFYHWDARGLRMERWQWGAS